MRATLAALILLAGLVLLALAVGDRAVPPGLLLPAVLGDASAPPDLAFILRELRLPRALMAVTIGATLAIAGAICQTAMRNALAEPGLVGINGGAALAALVLLIGFPAVSALWLPWAALAGALAMAAAIQLLGRRVGMRSQRIILIGLALGAVAGGISSFLSAMGDIAAVQRAVLWLSGSLQDSRWDKLRLLALWLLPCGGVALALARQLDLLRFQDEVVFALGQPAGAARALAMALCAALAGAAVAATGPIGFVGLVAPHAARLLAGPGHARLLPLAAVLGAILLLAADTAGRSLIAPSQIPAGIVTALIGAPFFAWLLWRNRND